MKSRFLMSIITSAIVLTGFGSSIGSSNVASAQNLPPGSVLIPQEQIDKLCKPGNFDWALRNHFQGIRLTRQQRNSIKPVYENYRKELREYLKNGQCTVVAPGYDPSFSKDVYRIFMMYNKVVYETLSKQQLVQWGKNVEALWAPPIRS